MQVAQNLKSQNQQGILIPMQLLRSYLIQQWLLLLNVRVHRFLGTQEGKGEAQCHACSS
jgi:hypothetical protein